MLGAPNAGFLGMMQSINQDRLLSASRSLGLAARGPGHGLRICRNERKAFGNAIGQHQGIQFMLADNDVDIEAARLLIGRAAELIEAGDPAARIAASRAKLFATKWAAGCPTVCSRSSAAWAICASCRSSAYRDARAFRIGEGTSRCSACRLLAPRWRSEGRIHVSANPDRP